MIYRKDSIKKWCLNNRENFTALFIMTVASFFILLRSPLHVWIGGETGTDSSVFKTIALMMERGFMPYRDSFDHKGPLLYLLNFWGNKISSYRGIWVIEMIFMSITLFMLYRIARLKCGKVSSYMISFFSTVLLLLYFDGGNLVEEYALLFIALSLYIFLDYLLYGNITKCRLVLCGLSFGGVLALRPNMIATWFVLCVAVLVKLVSNKKSKLLGQYVLWFTIGIFIIWIPIIIWLSMEGAIVQFWNDYVVFNMKYSSGGTQAVTLTERWKAFWKFFNTPTWILTFVTGMCVGLIGNKFVNISYIVYMIVNLCLVSISGKTYGHYGMILVPVVSYPLSVVLGEIEKIEFERVAKVIRMLVYIYLISAIVLPSWIPLLGEIPDIYEKRETDHKSQICRNVTNIINDCTEEDEAISVYGNWNIIYVIANRMHATRYSYQYPIGDIDSKILDEYFEELALELPKVIVIQNGHYDERIAKFIEENEYSLKWTEKGVEVEGALIYLRN